MFRYRIDGFTSRLAYVINMAVFWSKRATKTIVVNGNNLEFRQYFSLFPKNRYLNHLTICNQPLLTKLDRNRHFLIHIIHNFDPFFPSF